MCSLIGGLPRKFDGGFATTTLSGRTANRRVVTMLAKKKLEGKHSKRCTGVVRQDKTPLLSGTYSAFTASFSTAWPDLFVRMHALARVSRSTGTMRIASIQGLASPAKRTP